MKKLERKHARMTLAFMAVAILAAVAAMVISEKDELMGSVAFLVFLGFAAMAIYCRFRFLRCPTCRKGVAVPRWNPNGKHDICRNCKCPMYFDDEIRIRR